MANYYTKTETEYNLVLKADKSITYTKSEVDNRIANLVDSAPATLNTLKELATALNNDHNLSTSITNLIGTKANQSTTYTTTEVVALAQNESLFPSNEGSNRWGVIAASTKTVRRIVGAQPIRSFIELDLNNPSSTNDVQIGFDMDLTGLTNFCIKTETDNNLLLKSR